MLDRLETFASVHGPTFYGLPLNTGTVQLERNEAEEAVPGLMELENGSTTPTTLVPFHAGEPLNWRLNRAQWH